MYEGVRIIHLLCHILGSNSKIRIVLIYFSIDRACWLVNLLHALINLSLSVRVLCFTLWLRVEVGELRVRFISIVWVILDYWLHQILHVEVVKELLHGLLLLLEFDKELLRMAARLGAWSRPNVLLYPLPLLAMHFKSLKESQMLLTSPSACPFATLLFQELLTSQIWFTSFSINFMCRLLQFLALFIGLAGFCGRCSSLIGTRIAALLIFSLDKWLVEGLSLLWLNMSFNPGRWGDCSDHLHLFWVWFDALRQSFGIIFCQIKSRHQITQLLVHHNVRIVLSAIFCERDISRLSWCLI